MNFNGKVAYITGAGRGIGKEVSLLLASYGADIVIADIDINNAEQTKSEIESLNQKALSLQVDVTDKHQINLSVMKAKEIFGKIDILVNSAGVISTGKIVDAEEHSWNTVMDINAKGTFLTCQAIVKEMINQKSGKIINLSSIASKTAEYGNSVYCASKAAVNMISQTLALEVAEYNINVNAVCPAYTDTEMMQNVFTNRGPIEGMAPTEYKRHLESLVPLGRMARSTEIADLIAFLASDKSNFITGSTYTIAGGKELH